MNFHYLLPAKIPYFIFLKIYKTIFRTVLAISGHMLRPRAQIITFQKMASKFMEALTGLLRFYFKKFDVLLVYDLSIKIKRILIICLKYKMSMQINRSR